MTISQINKNLGSLETGKKNQKADQYPNEIIS